MNLAAAYALTQLTIEAANKCHSPAGSPEGGQFCSEPGAGGAAVGVQDVQLPASIAKAYGLKGRKWSSKATGQLVMYQYNKGDHEFQLFPDGKWKFVDFSGKRPVVKEGAGREELFGVMKEKLTALTYLPPALPATQKPQVVEQAPKADVKQKAGTVPDAHADNIASAKQLLRTYDEKRQVLSDDSLRQWEERIHSGQSPAVASKGLGVYPEMAAKMGLQPNDLRELRLLFVNRWVKGYEEHLQQGMQEVATGKVTSPAGKRLSLEYAVTQALLGEQDTVLLHRGVRGAYADGLAKQARRGDVKMKTQGVDSWTDDEAVAKEWGGVEDDGGVVLSYNVPKQYVMSWYKLTGMLKAGEAEALVAFPGQQTVLPKKAVRKYAGEEME